MANIEYKPVWSEDGQTLSNVLVKDKLETYNVVTEWYDGTPIDDSKLDSDLVYVKYEGKYLVRNFEYGQVLQKDTMQEMRDLSSYEILLLKMGVYKHVQLNGYYDKGDTPAPINYTLSNTEEEDNGGNIIRISDIKLVHELTDFVSVEYFGIVGDGEVDNTEQINKVLSLTGVGNIFFPKGIFKVTDEIRMRSYKSLQGRGGLWNANSSQTVFKFEGDDGDGKAVIRVSSQPIGIDPTTAMTKVVIKGITVDGSDSVDYGVYGAYVTNESSLTEISVINCKVGGLTIEKSWYATYEKITALNNGGYGMSFGSKRWGGVNGCKINNLQARGNGKDGEFDPELNPIWGYGVGLFQGAQLVASNVTSERNTGAGCVLSNDSQNSGFRDVYLELNCQGYSENWGILYESKPNCRGMFLENIYCWGSHPSGQMTQWIKLIGSELGGVIDINNVYYGRVSSDISRYRLSNVGYQISQYIVGSLPVKNYGERIYGRGAFQRVYVRDGGDDSNVGDSPSNAVKTLAKAMEIADRSRIIREINCEGAVLHEPEVDITKDITIEGGGSGKVTNTTNGRGIRINTSGNIVTLKGFESISRVIHEGDGVLTVENCNIGVTDAQNSAGVTSLYSVSGVTYIKDCTIDGIQGTHANKIGVDSRRRVYISGVDFINTTAKIRMYDSLSEVRINQDLVYQDITWVNHEGIVVATNGIFRRGGDGYEWILQEATTNTRGSVKKITQIGDSVATDLSELKDDFNDLLGKMRIAGILEE